jgi:hypothetical protein
MSMRPGVPVTSITPAEMEQMVARAGLVLNPGQTADLVLVWRQLSGLISSIPHDRPMVDDFASAFRLPPPTPAPVRRSPVKRVLSRIRKRAARGR